MNGIGRRSVTTLMGLTAAVAWAAPDAGPNGVAPTVVVRVPATSYAKTIGLGLSPIRAYDYGAFVWMELPSDEVGTLASHGVTHEIEHDPFTIRLGETSFDPRRTTPDLPARWKQGFTGTPNLQLVQFNGPPRQEWLDYLEQNDLKVVQYIHPRTYVVWGHATDRATVEAMGPSVRWTGAFEPGYRVLPKWRHLDARKQDVKVLLYRGANTKASLTSIKALGGRVLGRRIINDTFEVAGITLPGAQFNAASKIPGVYSIQVTPTNGGLRGELTDQINVNNVNASNVAFPGYQAWLTGVGLDGSGVIIANVDEGVQDTHPELVNRMLPCTGSTCAGGALSFHGTHTAGIMAADGSSGITDGSGFIRGLGVAPGANLVEQLYSPTFVDPGGMLLLMTESYNNGAALSGNSWGPSGTPLGYDGDTMQVDQGVRDADPDAPGNQPFTYVLSFMNGFGGTSTQGTPDEAKNVLTIGSTKAQTSGGVQILSINDISTNSAHGPALDGRTIPHMVAPGCFVDSTVVGSSHDTECGTSMASPQVSGAVALFIQYYRNLPEGLPDPSPALIKAAFLPVARDLAGFRDADNNILGHRFDSKQGWGRLDIKAVVDPPLPVLYFDNPQVFDNTGEEWNAPVSPADPAEPMKIMLVWTDAIGHGLGGSTPAWNNNLDLVVDAGADTYLGNVFGGNGWSTTGGTPDFRNNTEGVLLGPSAPSSVTIRVLATDVNSDGIPGTGDATDQDFALVCYNCVGNPGFTLTPDPSSRAVCAPDDAVYSLDIGEVFGFSEAVTLSASGLPGGTSAAFSTNPVTPPGNSTLTVSGTGAASEGSYTIGIDGVAPSFLQATSVTLDVFTGNPGTSQLLAPADEAANVSLMPDFSWTAAAAAAHYSLQIATDAAFADIVIQEDGLTDTTFRIQLPLNEISTYYWRIVAGNACGDGDASATFSFTTREVPPVLLVDDDDNAPDVRATYTDTLDAIGQEYDIWDTNNTDDEPTTVDLAQYSVVIWFTGNESGGAAGPGSAGEAALSTYLDAGNCLFLSGQDYIFDKGLTSFVRNYLGAQSVSDNAAQVTVTGTGPVYRNLGPYSLSYPFHNASDRITASGEAEIAFSGNNGDAAVTIDSGIYRTVFWGFPFEAITSPADREEVMTRTIDWCERSLVFPPLAHDTATRNRYLVFEPNAGDNQAAFQVELGASDTFPGATMTKWVDVPDSEGRAMLTDTQVMRNWNENVIKVAACGVVPASTYLIRSTYNGTDFSDPLVLITTPKPGGNKHWADCIGSFDGTSWSGPNGSTNIDDALAAIKTWQQVPTAPPVDWTDVHPEQPNWLVNFSDVLFIVKAFSGDMYPFSNPVDCP